MGADVANWLSRVEQTSIQIIVHSDTATTASVTCEIDEVQFGGSLTADVSVNGGNVQFNVTGLTAGTTYAFRCFIDGEAVSGGGTFTTDPVSYEGYRIGWWGCAEGYGSAWALANAHEQNLNMSIGMGDLGYHDFDTSKYTQTVYQRNDLSIATITSLENRLGRMLDHQKHPHRRKFSHKTPTLYMYDDHDGVCNDYTGNSLQLDSEIGLTLGTVTAQEHDDARAAAFASFDAYALGNPSNVDPGIDSDARYFRFTKGDIAEIFVLDSGNYRDSFKDLSPETGHGSVYKPPSTCSILGVNQKQWIKDRLKLSDSTFKVIMTTKKIYGDGADDNPDGYRNATGEREELFDFIEAGAGGGSDWNVPGGVLWCCGDIHTQSVSTTNQHVSFTPFGVFTTGHSLAGTTPGFVFKENFNGYGYLELSSNRINVFYIDDFGKTRYSGGVNAGSIQLN